MPRRPKSSSSYRRLSPAENVKAGHRPKARQYAPKDVKRIDKRTATISHRQYQTLRTQERFQIATPELATEARKRGTLSYSSAVQRESVAKAAVTREEKKYRFALEARDGQYIEANNPRRRRERVHITAAAIGLYLENRRKKLNGEYIPEGDWQQMMDIARAVGDARGELLRGSAKIVKPPPTANPYYAAATTAFCRRRIVEAACLDPHSIIFFATDAIVATNFIRDLPRVKAEDELLELGDLEYRKGHSGVFIHSGVYSYQKYEGGEWFALTKTRGLDPKRVTREKKINDVLVYQFLQAARRPYDSKLTIPIVIPSKHLVTIGMALAMAERRRDLWPLAGRWSPEPGTPNALPRYINCDEPGKKRQWIVGREADWQSTETREARRTSDYIPTIPAKNPMPPGVMSARYNPEWLDESVRDEIEDGDEQVEIAEAT